ncbi:hypothetical protein [Phaeobacter gallaeciensis]|nr:hypothetical protein [Phaeobacter gallaeciensis]
MAVQNPVDLFRSKKMIVRRDILILEQQPPIGITKKGAEKIRP